MVPAVVFSVLELKFIICSGLHMQIATKNCYCFMVIFALSDVDSKTLRVPILHNCVLSVLHALLVVTCAALINKFFVKTRFAHSRNRK